MTSVIKTRMNYTTSDGMKTVFPETKAKLIRLEGHTFANLQELLDGSGTFRVSDGTLQVLDKSTGGWSDVIIEGDSCEHPDLPPIDNVLTNVTGLGATVNGTSVTIKWTDPKDVIVQINEEVYVLTKWIGTKLVYKEGSEPENPNDGILVIDNTERNQFSTEGKTITDLSQGSTYFFKLFPYDDKERVVIDSLNAVSIEVPVFIDESGAPGSGNLVAGDINAGFLGEVPNTELITPIELSNKLGVTAGTSFNEDTPWLKFVYGGNILFIAKKPIRYNLSWDELDSSGVVYGKRTIKIGNHFYKVRLLKGAISDPYTYSDTDRGAIGSEWNKLMLPIHIQAKDGSWVHKKFVEENVPYWGIDYTDEDLSTHYTNDNGSRTWCQETPTEYPTGKVFRGYTGVSGAYYNVSSGKSDQFGWRPVLELVRDEDISDTSGAPGSPVLQAGDTTAGFFGEVPNTELITPLDLATRIGLSSGTSYNEDTPWLKFSLDGKILYTTKKPIRYNLSWHHINVIGAVYGKTVISIGDKYYKVRLFKGALNDPYSSSASDKEAKGSEWNRLMLPIHIKAKDSSWTYPEYVEDTIPDWGVGYTDIDLVSIPSAGNGSYIWCQEMRNDNPNIRVLRGANCLSNSHTDSYSNTSTSYGWRPVLELVAEDEIVDKSGTPGSPVLLGGDTTAGFFGEVPNADLITPATLTTKIGITAGTAIYIDTPWLKFILDGKILFTTKKPIRYNLSWDAINNANAVYGKNVISIGDKYYKIRLFKGALTDPYNSEDSDRGAKGSEWNRLMLPIHIQAKDKSWAYKDYVEEDVPNWNIGYTDTDLALTSSYNGSYTLCQETNSFNTNTRAIHGYYGVSYAYYATSTSSATSYGWRPVLELVTDEEIVDKSGAPGSPVIVGGDKTTGFYGEVPSTEFTTGTDLSGKLSISSYGSIALTNSTTPWLKFSLDGKIVFIPKKPIGYSVTWKTLYDAKAVYGNSIVKIKDHYYRVRLIKGASKDPFSNSDITTEVKGSEWNRLMLPIHIQAKDKSWTYPNYVDENVPDWGIGYKDSDLGTTSTTAAMAWCQEQESSTSTNVICRGYGNVANVSVTNNTSVSSNNGWRPILELVDPSEFDDLTGTPGSPALIGGDTTAGFFGEVPNSELITPSNLTSTIGLSGGTSYNTDTPWLKFILDGKILFTTKKPIRYSISWDAINEANAVYGDKTVQIGTDSYRVRLFEGTITDPASSSTSDKDAKGSEWNRLMLPIHIKAKDKSWNYPDYVDSDVPDWGIGYTDSDLLVQSSTNGSCSWCVNSISGSDTGKVQRGGYGVSYITQNNSPNASTTNGWRPVLEYIPKEELKDTSGAPGPVDIKAGDKTTGFYGEVSNTGLIKPTALAEKIGLTNGTSYNEDTPWLKFILDGKVLFTTKKPIRHTVSWNHLNTVNAVDGTNIIDIEGKKYKVRLFRGVTSQGDTPKGDTSKIKTSEWNRLMIPIHIKTKNKSWSYPAYVDTNTPYWGIDYTDADLSTDNTETWCYEETASQGYRYSRGYPDVSYVTNTSQSSAASSYVWRPLLEYVPDELIITGDTTPGSNVILGGNRATGFLGEVPNEQLITPANLASTIGLAKGTSYNEDTPWLKFILDGKILFVSKKPVRYNLTWQQIDAVGAVYGTTTVKAGGKTYKVRLLKGVKRDPYPHTSTSSETQGSEWNRLMLPIHIKAKDKSWSYSQFVESDIPDWGIGYTNEDLLTSSDYGSGTYNWCQETSSDNDDYRAIRGYYDVSYASMSTRSMTGSTRGWRPVLELVE